MCIYFCIQRKILTEYPKCPATELFVGMRGSRKFCQRVSKFDEGFFLLLLFIVGEGIEDPNWLSSARQRNAIEMAFRCRADDGPTLNAGLVAL